MFIVFNINGGGITSLMSVVEFLDQDIFGIVPQAKCQYLQSRAFDLLFYGKV